MILRFELDEVGEFGIAPYNNSVHFVLHLQLLLEIDWYIPAGDARLTLLILQQQEPNHPFLMRVLLSTIPSRSLGD